MRICNKIVSENLCNSKKRLTFALVNRRADYETY
jgi:hypothetical protein